MQKSVQERNQAGNTPRGQVVEEKLQKQIDVAMQMIKECEMNFNRLENEDDCDNDEEFKSKQNAKICLAISLKEVTPQLRLYQQQISNQLQLERPPPMEMQEQLQRGENDFEIEYLEYIAKDRNERIQQLGQKILKMTELFRELNRLVIEQGTLLDRIDFNLELTFQRVHKGKVELVKVYKSINIYKTRQIPLSKLVVGLRIVFAYWQLQIQFL